MNKNSKLNVICPFFGNSVFNYSENIFENALSLINEDRLFRVGFGYSKKNITDSDYKKLKTETIEPMYDNMKRQIKENNIFKPVMLFGFFKTLKNENGFYILENENKYLIKTTRSEKPPYIALEDFFLSEDIIGATLVSSGLDYQNYLRKLYDNDEYKDYYFYYALGAELTECLADIMHRHLLKLLNLESYNLSKKIGSRYSFGYPALKDISGNKIIFDLLNAKNYGIKITGSFMMEPELTTSALICFNENAYYFS